MAHNLAPGYCVVEHPGTLEYQARELFRDIRSPATSLFMTLNADTHYLKPGQILIVADPDTPDSLTRQMLATLRQAKNNTNSAFVGVNGDDASFMQKHYGMIAALTGAGDKIFSTAGDAGEKYFNAIEQILRKIEASYQNQYRTQGSLIGQQFFVERNQLLHQLKELVNKPLLKSLATYTIKFRQYENMKRALNLSSRSIVHEWSTAGIGGIPGYSYYVGNAARAARFLKTGGYVGIGFGLAATTNDVVNLCMTGREGECGKVAFRKYSSFTAGTAGGIVGGAYGSAAAMSVCAGIGIVSAGIGGIACAVVGGIAGGYLGGTGLEKAVNKFIEFYDDK